MAFDNVTLFELHLDDARFTRTAESEDTAQDEEDAEHANGPRVGRLILASIALSIVVSLVARRFASSNEDLEDNEDVEPIEIDAEAPEAEN